MASPRTNFEAPSMAPVERSFRPRAACGAGAPPSRRLRPADRSASIAICLPGMASRLKRAATSAMRPEPLVMTMKFTITRIVNTMMPMTKLPAITKLPKASMTCPAGGRCLRGRGRGSGGVRGEVEREPQPWLRSGAPSGRWRIRAAH